MRNASLFVILAIDQLDREPTRARPSDIHVEHHLCPIVGIDAAIASIDAQDRSIAIVRAAQHGLQLHLFDFALQPG